MISQVKMDKRIPEISVLQASRPKRTKRRNQREKQVKVSSTEKNLNFPSKLPKIPSSSLKHMKSPKSLHPKTKSSIDLIYKAKEKMNFNTSLDDDLIKLESLTTKNVYARLDLISIQERMIQIQLNKKLSPITEKNELTAQIQEDQTFLSKNFEIKKPKTLLSNYFTMNNKA